MRKQRPVFVLQNQQRGTALLCVEAWTENKDSWHDDLDVDGFGTYRDERHDLLLMISVQKKRLGLPNPSNLVAFGPGEGLGSRQQRPKPATYVLEP